MEKQINIETMSVEALKALAYDIIVAIQNDQGVLNRVNEEIAKRAKSAQEEKNINP